MLVPFKQHIQINFPDCFQKKILVAVSGGVDSIVLAFLFKKLNFNIILAHCNFQLRGNESKEDENFVKNFSKKWNIPIRTIQFETKKIAKEKKTNTQLTARELRYEWFKQVALSENCDFIATAHHSDDNLETFFINLSRGSGISGLIGIPNKNGKIIRPLLPFSRDDIKNFAIEQQLLWREDSSNHSDAYTRNKIRHHITPLLQSIHPKFKKNLQKTQLFLEESQGFINQQIQFFKKNYFKKKENYFEFYFEEISKHPQRQFIVFEIFKPYGFTNKTDLNLFFESKTGKQLFSKTHRIIKNRNFWILCSLEKKNNEIFFINENDYEVSQPIPLKFQHSTNGVLAQNTLKINKEKITFPLKIRKWEQGDFFFPKGMNGKKKLLSKFFKDEKYSALEKENQWILTTANNEIIWVIGKRADERFSTDFPNFTILLDNNISEN